MVGIIGAMSVEVDGIVKKLKSPFKQIIGSLEFWRGFINEYEVVISRSGVGKVNAAVATQTMIHEFKPEFIINSGVAGAIVPNLNVGDIVVASSVVQYDVDTSALGDPIGFISGVDVVFIKCAKDICKNLLEVSLRISKLDGKSAHSEIIATGDKFVNSREDGMQINKLFGAVATEMEGASVGQVCLLNNVDFCVVRIISDSVYRNSELDYKEFVSYAANKSVSLITKFLSRAPVKPLPLNAEI